MTDSDDAISRRYRDGAREEPPAALDAAILAASRRAVGAGPRRAQRWMVPASIAAVLVLGIGVALRMQMEQPGIETSLPAGASSAEYPMPEQRTEMPAQAPAPAAPPPELAKDAVQPSPRAAARAPAPARKPIKPADLPPEAVTAAPGATAAAPAPVSTESAPAPAAIALKAPPAPAAPASQPAPAPLQDLAAAQAPAPMARMEAAPRERAQRQAGTTTAIATPAPPQARNARDVELERIARLRAEGRHEEADKALEAFRRDHPQYRFPDDVWERVRPR